MSGLLVFRDTDHAYRELGTRTVHVVSYAHEMHLSVAAVLDRKPDLPWLALTTNGRADGPPASVKGYGQQWLDRTWELLMERRLRTGMKTRVLGLGRHSEETILRYPWDAVIVRRGLKAAIAAHPTRWKR